MAPTKHSLHAELEARLRFEMLLSDLSARFINLPSDQVDREIKTALRDVCEHLELDLASLWQSSVDTPGSFAMTHFYQSEEGVLIPECMNSRELFPWSQRQVNEGKTVSFSSVEDAPPEAARDKETWRQCGAKSALTIPLSVGGGPSIGVLSFNTTRQVRTWPEDIVNRLQLVSRTFANSLARKYADQAWRESEERLSMAVDAAGVGFWMLDMETNQIWATDKIRQLFQYAPDEDLTVDRFMESVYPADREAVQQAIRQALHDGTEFRIEYRIVRSPDDGIGWIAARGRRRRGAPESEARLTGICVDATERKMAENVRRGYEERLRSAIDVAGLGFYELGEGFRATFMDDRMRQLLGIPPGNDACVRDFWLAQIHADDLSQVLEVSQKVLWGGVNRFTVDYRYIHPTQGEIWIHHLSRVLERDTAGQAIQVLGVIQDITESKRLEVDAQQIRQELMHVTRVTTMGELTTSLAHEINQPLTAILANAQAGRRLIDSEHPDLAEIREILLSIAADDHRAGEIIRRMRNLIKKEEIELQPLDLNELIKEMEKLIHTDALIKGVRITKELSADLPPVQGDRVQLQQVLLNLIVNAFDAMQSGTGARELTLCTRWSAADGVVVAVRDSGVGIPPERIPVLFTPFFTSKSGGLGMGLPICRSILAANGGHIWAENNADQGPFSSSVFQSATERPNERSGGYYFRHR